MNLRKIESKVRLSTVVSIKGGMKPLHCSSKPPTAGSLRGERRIQQGPNKSSVLQLEASVLQIEAR